MSLYFCLEVLHLNGKFTGEKEKALMRLCLVVRDFSVFVDGCRLFTRLAFGVLLLEGFANLRINFFFAFWVIAEEFFGARF